MTFRNPFWVAWLGDPPPRRSGPQVIINVAGNYVAGPYVDKRITYVDNSVTTADDHSQHLHLQAAPAADAPAVRRGRGRRRALPRVRLAIEAPRPPLNQPAPAEDEVQCLPRR
jgi:hypothetical protein